MHQLVSEPTHLNNGGKPTSLLDLAFTNVPHLFEAPPDRAYASNKSASHLPVIIHRQHPGSQTISRTLFVAKTDSMHERALASGFPDHWKINCLARNRATAAIKQAKQTHFNKQTHALSDAKCSPSKWWQIARDLCGKGSASTGLLSLMGRSRKVVKESNAKADLLNEVFVNHNTSLAPDAYIFGPSPLNVTFDLGNIYPSNVLRVLRSLPNKSSCGSDKISYRMMKEAGPGLVGPS